MDHNFTTNLYMRIFESLVTEDPREINKTLLDKSSIKIRMDITNQHIAFTLQMKFVEAFEMFMKQLVILGITFTVHETILTSLSCLQISSCDLPEELASIPLVFEEPIYGTTDLTFTDFMAPGRVRRLLRHGPFGDVCTRVLSPPPQVSY